MRIGITERGDAGIDFMWEKKLSAVDGAILITKSLNETFRQKVLELHIKGFPIIVHCTCTGWGGTIVEPNVPRYETQLEWLEEFVRDGFPAQNIVMRIDPIFPTRSGLNRVGELLDSFQKMNIGLPERITRIRVSILDEYRHVKQRFVQHGFQSIYGDSVFANEQQIQEVANLLNQFAKDNLMLRFETCAEESLFKKLDPEHARCTGCVGIEDMTIMGLPTDELRLYENPQHRKGCHCLSCKTELLERKHPCTHDCLYCYWT